MPPIVLKIKGSRPFLPFAELDNEDDLSKTWRVCTKVKDSLENGSRLENLSWRLWHLHQLIASGKRKVRPSAADGASSSSSSSTTACQATASAEARGQGTYIHMPAFGNGFTATPLGSQAAYQAGGMQVDTNATSTETVSAGATQRSTFRSISKTATRIMDSDDNEEQREFERRVRQFSPTSTRNARTSAPTINWQSQSTATPTIEGNSEQMTVESATAVPQANTQLAGPTAFNSASPIAATTPTAANNPLWLQNATASAMGIPSSTPTPTIASFNIPHAAQVMGGHQQSIGTHASAGQRAITTTTNTMLPAPSAVYPPYQAYTAGNDLSELIGAAASMFPQFMGMRGTLQHTQAIANPPAALTGTAAGVLLNDMFGAFPAAAYLGDLSQPPTIEIPLEQVLQAQGISMPTASATAAAPPTWSSVSTPSGTRDSGAVSYFDSWLAATAGTAPGTHVAPASTCTSPHMAARMSNNTSHLHPMQAMHHIARSPTGNPAGECATTSSTIMSGNTMVASVGRPTDQLLPVGSASISGLGGGAGSMPVSPLATSMSGQLPGDIANSFATSTFASGLTPNASQPATELASIPPSGTASPVQLANNPTLTAPQLTAVQSSAVGAEQVTYPAIYAAANHPQLITASAPQPSSLSATQITDAIELSQLNSSGQMACCNCGVTSTPLWRRSADDKMLCNACGLYLKLHNMARPKPLKANRKEAKSAADTSSASSSIGVKSSMVCSNCKTTNTPLWRRDEHGAVLCNACGLYLKLHQARRPLSLKTDVIKKRQRYDGSSKGKKGKGTPGDAVSDGETNAESSKGPSSAAKKRPRNENRPGEQPPNPISPGAFLPDETSAFGQLPVMHVKQEPASDGLLGAPALQQPNMAMLPVNNWTNTTPAYSLSSNQHTGHQGDSNRHRTGVS